VSDIAEQFIIEARELVHHATDDLITLEREGPVPERIDRVFRALHTLKGSAGLVDLPAMNLTMHAAEDLLAAVRAGKQPMTPAIVDQTLACLDQVSKWIDDFAAEQSLPARAGDDARAMAERLRALIGADVPGHPVRTALTVPDAGIASADWVLRLIELRRRSGAPTVDETATGLVAVSYEPHATCFLDGIDPLDLMRKIPRLLALHVEPREPWPPLADMDPFACHLRLQALSAADRATVSGIFRLVPDQVRIVDVAPAALTQERLDTAADASAVELIKAVLEEQRQVLHVAGQNDDLAGRIGAVARVVVNALGHGRRAELAERVEPARADALSRGVAAPLISAIDAALQSLAGASPPDGSADDDGQDAASAPTRTGQATPAPSRSIRIDEAKIDALFNLAGELIVAKNGLAHLARRVEDAVGEHELARAVRREHDLIERLAGEMHAAVLQLRLVPVAQVFRSFPRLLRDMARRLDKKIELATRGETMEGDKTIIDGLFEPLLHLVRNAVDHGIETPEQRRSAGKAETARIIMQASRAGDRFIVEIVDDGRGIDPAVIGRQASERGLITAEQLSAMSDEQVLDLVFTAGFSTATEISDISGRGIGLDAVRAAVEAIGGRVSLTSRLGVGTTARLDLPAHMAISRIMVVEAGGQAFGIAMDAVSETMRLMPDRISHIKNNAGFVLRDRVVPICSLAELMSLPAVRASSADAKLLVVTETGGKTTAIEVDAIRDRLEVVLKPMQGLLSNARGYSGTTLLGDGGVLLVLDLKEILP
jgi:two-component system chemotaxis sensor kinase CheA